MDAKSVKQIDCLQCRFQCSKKVSEEHRNATFFHCIMVCLHMSNRGSFFVKWLIQKTQCDALDIGCQKQSHLLQS